MKNAIILHGMPGREEYYSTKYPSASNFHWLPWLQKQFLIADILAVTPEMPNSFSPDYFIWKREFERFDITPETILVGHSCGGGFLVRYLSEHKNVKVGKVVLVAPWIDPEKELSNGFFEFEIDKDLVNRTKRVTIFHSDNDSKDINTSVDLITNVVGDIKLTVFKGYGHFIPGDMESSEFPELLEESLLSQ